MIATLPSPFDLDTLSLIVEIAEAGSLVGAGRARGVSASAVGKGLVRLEGKLGARLFHRSTRSLKPTSEGVLLLGRARRILAEAAAAQAEILDRTAAPRGRLRVGLPLVGEPFLGTLAAFGRAYPEVDLDILFSDRRVDLIEEGFDAVVRSGAVADTRLIARSLGRFRMVLAAAPTYLATRGTPSRVEDLIHHRCIRFRFAHDGRLGAWPLGEAQVEPPGSLVCNNLEARVAFAVAGLGIALLPDFGIATHLRDGQLVRVLDAVAEEVALRILWPASGHPVPKLRAFVDFMVKGLPFHAADP